MSNKNGIAPMGVCGSPSGLSKGAFTKHYTTTTSPVNTLINNIDPDGDGDARMKAMTLLMRKGYSNFQSPDWLAYNPEGRIEAIEVKYKELYEPPPFWGAGLDVKQVGRRMRLLNDKSVRTYLIVFGKGVNEGETYMAYLDELERKGGSIDTPGGQRIYPISSFSCITTLTTIGKGAVKNDN